MVNYADDNTPYVCEGDMNKIILTLEGAASKLFLWISQKNYLKANPDKSHLLSNNEERIIYIQSEVIENAKSKNC